MWEMKTLLLQEMFARGILTLGTHNISYAHSQSDIEHLLAAYSAVMPIMHEASERGVGGLLRCEPLVPLFRVR
jgi:glutamate-1-semialdehyde 2,1-aminomutase